MAKNNLPTPPELAAFCGQLALVVKAGLGPHEGILSLREDALSQEELDLYDRLLGPLSQGKPLWFALRESQVFPDYLVDMVEIGENAGRLDEVLDSLCSYYETGSALTQNIKQALAYPLVMILMMGAVIALLVQKVLPIFEQVFAQLGSGLSHSVGQMIRGGQILTELAVLLTALLLLLLLAILLLHHRENGRQALYRFFGRCPLTRGISEKIAAGRFARAMSLMLASGMDLTPSVELAQRLVENPTAQRKIQQLLHHMEAGDSFSKALTQSQLFSAVNARLVSLAFRTGSVDGVLGQIAQGYDQEVEDSISRMTSLLEPTLVAALSTVVGLILLSVMLPLMGMMSSIG